MIFIFSGPSGVGKSTIINALRQKRDFQFSVSYTSRNIREGEYNGEDYNFVSETEFLKLIDEDFFIEYEKYGTDFYGTGMDQLSTSNPITVLDVEVNGATKLLNENKSFIGIFIDIENEELIERLKERGHDEEFINKRMNLANEQRSKINEFDFIVKNVDINTTVKEIIDIICNLEES